MTASSNEYPQHVLWRNTDSYAYMLILSSNALFIFFFFFCVCVFDQIQKISKIDNIYFI